MLLLLVLYGAPMLYVVSISKDDHMLAETPPADWTSVRRPLKITTITCFQNNNVPKGERMNSEFPHFLGLTGP